MSTMLALTLYNTMEVKIVVEGIEIPYVPSSAKVFEIKLLTTHVIDVKLANGKSMMSKLAYLKFYKISEVPICSDLIPRGDLELPFTLSEFEDYSKVFFWKGPPRDRNYSIMLKNYFMITDFLMPKSMSLYFFNGWMRQETWEFVDTYIDAPFMPIDFLKRLFLSLHPHKYYKCLSREFFVKLFVERILAKSETDWTNYNIRDCFMKENKLLFIKLGYDYEKLVEEEYQWRI